jgi:hypothetical protein
MVVNGHFIQLARSTATSRKTKPIRIHATFTLPVAEIATMQPAKTAHTRV